jgi:hypothetical protein
VIYPLAATLALITMGSIPTPPKNVNIRRLSNCPKTTYFFCCIFHFFEVVAFFKFAEPTDTGMKIKTNFQAPAAADLFLCDPACVPEVREHTFGPGAKVVRRRFLTQARVSL